MKPALAAVAVSISIALGFGQVSDSVEQYRKDLESNPKSSLAHFRIGELYLQLGNLNAAANEFRSALNGDMQPKWTEVWSHINLGRIYDNTGQRDRAVNEYQLAQRTTDNAGGAQDEATRYLAQAQPTIGRNSLTIIERAVDRDLPPELLETTPPEYSDEARIAELEGTVILTGVAGQDGQLKDVRVTQHLGLGLDDEAIKTARQWRFKPGTHQGRPDDLSTTIKVAFEFPSKQYVVRAAFRPPARHRAK